MEPLQVCDTLSILESKPQSGYKNSRNAVLSCLSSSTWVSLVLFLSKGSMADLVQSVFHLSCGIIVEIWDSSEIVLAGCSDIYVWTHTMQVVWCQIVFQSSVGNWCKDWQLDWTTADHNWTAVASCPVCQKSKRPVVDWLQPVFLRTSHLAHNPPIQGHIRYFFHISIYLFEFTRALSIMISP